MARKYRKQRRFVRKLTLLPTSDPVRPQKDRISQQKYELVSASDFLKPGRQLPESLNPTAPLVQSAASVDNDVCAFLRPRNKHRTKRYGKVTYRRNRPANSLSRQGAREKMNILIAMRAFWESLKSSSNQVTSVNRRGMTNVRKLIVTKLAPLRKSPFYSRFLNRLIRDLAKNLDRRDIVDLSMYTLSLAKVKTTLPRRTRRRRRCTLRIGNKLGSYLNNCHMQSAGLFYKGPMKKPSQRIMLDRWCKAAKSCNNDGRNVHLFYSGSTYKVAPYKLLIHGADDHKNNDPVPYGSWITTMEEPAAGVKKKTKKNKYKSLVHPADDHKSNDPVPTGSETSKMKDRAAGRKKTSKQKKKQQQQQRQRQQPICEYPVAANSNTIGLATKLEKWLDLATLVSQQEQLLLSRQTKKKPKSLRGSHRVP